MLRSFGSSDCFKPPFFFSSSLLYSTGFLPWVFVWFHLIFIGWSHLLSQCFFSIRFFIIHFICWYIILSSHLSTYKFLSSSYEELAYILIQVLIQAPSKNLISFLTNVIYFLIINWLEGYFNTFDNEKSSTCDCHVPSILQTQVTSNHSKFSLYHEAISFKSFRSFPSLTGRKWANTLHESWRNVSTIQLEHFVMKNFSLFIIKIWNKFFYIVCHQHLCSKWIIIMKIV